MKQNKHDSIGKLITLEGIDGSGKTTHIEAIKSYLTDRGIPVITTGTPGGSMLGGSLLRYHTRAAILQGAHIKAELLLFVADMIQQQHETIDPSLKEGTWVISDRYLDSTFAYQGYGRGIPLNQIWKIAEYASLRQPSLTLYLDVDIHTAKERIHCREKLDHFEQQPNIFYRKVKEGYENMQTNNPFRIKTINANNNQEQVKTDILKAIHNHFFKDYE